MVKEEILTEGVPLTKAMGVSYSRFCELVLVRIIENASFRDDLGRYIRTKREQMKKEQERNKHTV